MELNLDVGNADIKWYAPQSSIAPIYAKFSHNLAEFSENEWRQIIGRADTPPKGYALINGVGYAFGDTARRHTLREKPKGAARYRADYFGVIAAYAIAIASQGKQVKNILLHASHAPQDIDYAKDLVASMNGHWDVQTTYGRQKFRVQEVLTFDEPIGGFANFTLTKKGQAVKNNPIVNKTILVIDVGGYTTDIVPVDPGGEIDITAMGSTRIGVIDTIARYEKDIRSNHRKRFQTAGNLDYKRIEQGIITGYYPYGNTPIDTIRESTEAKNRLINDILQIVENVGGAANYDAILGTGGGFELIHLDLANRLPFIDIHKSEQDSALMQFANVFGGGKLLRMMDGLNIYG